MHLAWICLSLLLAAPAKKEWSEAHGIGASIPNSWAIVKRDDGPRAFVVEGPRLGAGRPRLVIWNGGAAGNRTLKKIVEEFDAQVRKRPGWSRTAMVEHKVGRWPAMRLGYGFQEGDKAKGRARVSVVLYGGNVLVLEMSGAARGFPAATFDRVERSLEMRATRVKLEDEATVDVPPGWKGERTEYGFVAQGPRAAIVRLIREGSGDASEIPPPPEARLDGKFGFQGKKLPVYTETRKLDGEPIRMAWQHHRGWTAVVMMPEAAWPEIGPGAEALLLSLKTKKKPPAEKTAPSQPKGKVPPDPK